MFLHRRHFYPPCFLPTCRKYRHQINPFCQLTSTRSSTLCPHCQDCNCNQLQVSPSVLTPVRLDMAKPRYWKKSETNAPLKAPLTWETDHHERHESDCGCYTHKSGGSWEVTDYYGPDIWCCGHCGSKDYKELRVIWYADSISRNGDMGTEWELVCLACKRFTMFTMNE